MNAAPRARRPEALTAIGPKGPPYLGKHRGKVLNNLDVEGLGRLQVSVPAIPGIILNWALPCVPYAGPSVTGGVGFFAIPPIGADVWVEFEGGNPEIPIWSGCFWQEGQVPVEPAIPQNKVFKTDYITLKLSDVPEAGGLSIEVLPPVAPVPLRMTFNATGISISCPESTVSLTPEMIELSVPPATVSVSAEAIALGIPPSAVTLGEAGIAVESDEVNVTANVSVTGPMEVEGNLEITGAVEVEGNVEITGGFELVEGEAVFLTAALMLAAESAVTITAPAILLTGLTEATPDLLIDGQQPIVI